MKKETKELTEERREIVERRLPRIIIDMCLLSKLQFTKGFQAKSIRKQYEMDLYESVSGLSSYIRNSSTPDIINKSVLRKMFTGTFKQVIGTLDNYACIKRNLKTLISILLDETFVDNEKALLTLLNLREGLSQASR